MHAGIVEGRVIDDLGSPVGEAKVVVLGLPSCDWYGTSYSVLGEAITTVDGAFSLREVPAGPCLVQADVEGKAPLERTPLNAPAEGMVLVCPRWGRVRFRLVPPEGESSPDRIDLEIASSPSYQSDSAYTVRPDGYFEKGNFAPGAQEFRILALGWAPLRARFVAEAGRVVDIGEFRLSPGHSVRGLVVDEEGAPLADAWVHPSGLGTPDYLTTYTDAAGGFRMHHLPSGEVEFCASATGYVADRFAVQVPSAGDGVLFVLKRGGILHVRIRTKDGYEPYSCSIRVVDLDAPGPGRDWVEGQVSVGGDFHLSLRPGRYRICQLRGGTEIVASREVVLTRAGEATVEFVEDWD